MWFSGKLTETVTENVALTVTNINWKLNNWLSTSVTEKNTDTAYCEKYSILVPHST